MVTIYIVEHLDWSNSYIVGAYSSRERAVAEALLHCPFEIYTYKLDEGAVPPEGQLAFEVLIDRYGATHQTDATVPPESGYSSEWIFASDWDAACAIAKNQFKNSRNKEQQNDEHHA